MSNYAESREIFNYSITYTTNPDGTQSELNYFQKIGFMANTEFDFLTDFIY